MLYRDDDEDDDDVDESDGRFKYGVCAVIDLVQFAAARPHRCLQPPSGDMSAWGCQAARRQGGKAPPPHLHHLLIIVNFHRNNHLPLSSNPRPSNILLGALGAMHAALNPEKKRDVAEQTQMQLSAFKAASCAGSRNSSDSRKWSGCISSPPLRSVRRVLWDSTSIVCSRTTKTIIVMTSSGQGRVVLVE